MHSHIDAIAFAVFALQVLHRGTLVSRMLGWPADVEYKSQIGGTTNEHPSKSGIEWLDGKSETR